MFGSTFGKWPGLPVNVREIVWVERCWKSRVWSWLAKMPCWWLPPKNARHSWLHRCDIFLAEWMWSVIKRNTWGSPLLHLYLRTAPEGFLHSFLSGERSSCPYLVERGRESLMVTHRVSLAKGGARWVEARFIQSWIMRDCAEWSPCLRL